tara:strand:+ start:681 stop:1268 length:588 start_codon:yes stop_codon:yes gene_type:complete
MNRLLLILILTFSFQTLSKADDISDFQIEGISVGDSLLTYMSASEIKENYLNQYHNKSKFISINYPNTNSYDSLYIYSKRNDAKYKIYALRAMNLIENKKLCLKNKKEIKKEMKLLFKRATFQEGKRKHYYYKNSTQYISQFYYGEDGRFSPGARVECLIISKKEQEKYNTASTLEVIIQLNAELGRWLESGDAY